MDAAEQVIFAQGFERATVEDIARAAELAKGTIYRYFSTKTDVYLGVAARGLYTLTEYVQQRTHDVAKDADASVMSLLRAYSDFASAHPGHFEAFSYFSASELAFDAPSESLLACLERYALLHNEIQNFVTNGHTAGFWPTIPDAPLVAAFIAMVTTGFLKLRVRREDYFALRYNTAPDALLSTYGVMVRAFLVAHGEGAADDTSMDE